MFEWFKEIKNLKKKYDDLNEKYLKLYDENETEISKNIRLEDKLLTMMERYKKEVALKDVEIDKLKQEILMYRKYYKFDEEPSEEIQIAVRTDERVFALTLENIGLRNNK